MDTSQKKCMCTAVHTLLVSKNSGNYTWFSNQIPLRVAKLLANYHTNRSLQHRFLAHNSSDTNIKFLLEGNKPTACHDIDFTQETTRKHSCTESTSKGSIEKERTGLLEVVGDLSALGLPPCSMTAAARMLRLVPALG